MTNSRNKGASFEREVANLLNSDLRPVEFYQKNLRTDKRETPTGPYSWKMVYRM